MGTNSQWDNFPIQTYINKVQNTMTAERKTKSSSTLIDVKEVGIIRTKEPNFKDGRTLLNAISLNVISDDDIINIGNVFEMKTLDEIAGNAKEILVITFKYDKFPLSENYKEIFALFHEMNKDFGRRDYWVAPSYVYDNRTVGYVCLRKQR